MTLADLALAAEVEHDRLVSSLHDVYWPDAAVRQVTYDHDVARVLIGRDGLPGQDRLAGMSWVVIAEGLIGVRHIGMWDEMHVERATLHANHPFAAECWLEVVRLNGREPVPSGSPQRNTLSYLTLEIEFQDRAVLLLAAASFRVDRP